MSRLARASVSDGHSLAIPREPGRSRVHAISTSKWRADFARPLPLTRSTRLLPAELRLASP